MLKIQYPRAFAVLLAYFIFLIYAVVQVSSYAEVKAIYAILAISLPLVPVYYSFKYNRVFFNYIDNLFYLLLVGSWPIVIATYSAVTIYDQLVISQEPLGLFQTFAIAMAMFYFPTLILGMILTKLNKSDSSVNE